MGHKAQTIRACCEQKKDKKGSPKSHRQFLDLMGLNFSVLADQ